MIPKLDLNSIELKNWIENDTRLQTDERIQFITSLGSTNRLMERMFSAKKLIDLSWDDMEILCWLQIHGKLMDNQEKKYQELLSNRV